MISRYTLSKDFYLQGSKYTTTKNYKIIKIMMGREILNDMPSTTTRKTSNNVQLLVNFVKFSNAPKGRQRFAIIANCRPCYIWRYSPTCNCCSYVAIFAKQLAIFDYHMCTNVAIFANQLANITATNVAIFANQFANLVTYILMWRYSPTSSRIQTHTY